MFPFRITIRRIACSFLFLTTAVSAQRYTGHDHAVFHRPPQPPPAAVKHQTPSPANGTANRTKNGATASGPQTPHTSTGQGKLDADANRNSAPTKTDPPLDNPPRL